MQQSLALIGIQGTIFSEHEVFRVYDFEIVSFLHFQYFQKYENNESIISFIICTNFLVGNTVNILI